MCVAHRDSESVKRVKERIYSYSESPLGAGMFTFSKGPVPLVSIYDFALAFGGWFCRSVSYFYFYFHFHFLPLMISAFQRLSWAGMRRGCFRTFTQNSKSGNFLFALVTFHQCVESWLRNRRSGILGGCWLRD